MELPSPSIHPIRTPFIEKVKQWSDNASAGDFPDWEEQIKLLSEIGELITPDLTLEEIASVIYLSVNKLMDAYQFAVGIYNPEEGTLLFKGMIDNSQQLPDILIDANVEDRFGPWCIHHKTEIFINDVDKEFNPYVKTIPIPKAGVYPKAMMYVPLFMNGKVAGIITVRSPHTNVYQRHHLYILKTLGNFAIRSLALSEQRLKPSMKSESGQKNWHWTDKEKLTLKEKAGLSSLTEREKDVLFHLVSGLSNKAIAEKLFVAPGTVKTHTLNLYQKMEVSNRTSAIMKAIEMNWLM